MCGPGKISRLMIPNKAIVTTLDVEGIDDISQLHTFTLMDVKPIVWAYENPLTIPNKSVTALLRRVTSFFVTALLRELLTTFSTLRYKILQGILNDSPVLQKCPLMIPLKAIDHATSRALTTFPISHFTLMDVKPVCGLRKIP